MASASFSHFSTFRGPEKIPNSKTLISSSRSHSYPLLVSSPFAHFRSHHHHQISRSLSASVSTQQQIRTSSDDLVCSILSKFLELVEAIRVAKEVKRPFRNLLKRRNRLQLIIAMVMLAALAGILIYNSDKWVSHFNNLFFGLLFGLLSLIMYFIYR